MNYVDMDGHIKLFPDLQHMEILLRQADQIPAAMEAVERHNDYTIDMKLDFCSLVRNANGRYVRLTDTDSTLPAELLVELISKKPLGLKKLQLKNLAHVGDVNPLFSFLSNAVNLLKLEIDSFDFTCSPKDVRTLGTSLANMPFLQDLRLSVNPCAWDLLGPTLENSDRNLKHINFGFHCCQNEAKVMDDRFCNAIAASNVLESLSIHTLLTASHTQGICKIIQQSNTLKKIWLCTRSTSVVMHLVEALRVNTSIEDIALGGTLDSPVVDAVAAIHELVKYYNFHICLATPLFDRSVECRANYSIDEIKDHDAKVEHHRDAIFFHTGKINRFYRSTFMDSHNKPSGEQWVKLITSEELPVIFYLLQENVYVVEELNVA